MLSHVDSFRRVLSLAGCALLAGGLLAGCAAPVAQGLPSPGTSSTAVQLPVSPVLVTTSTPSPTPLPLPVQVQDAVEPILVYADQIRPLQGAELAQEIARLAEVPAPAAQVKLALALAQTRQLYDLVRAQDLLQRVLINASTEARLLHPLARTLSARFTEQRRVEDQLERQGAQLRDTQRRLEQTNDKLEALKEIERSLSRPGAANAAPVSGNRRRTPAP